MRAAGMAERTVTERVAFIDRFAETIGEDPVTVAWQRIAVFMGQPGFSAGTRRTYYAHLRAWFLWLVLFDYRLDNPMVKLRPPKSPRRRPRPITPTQLEQLVSTRMHRRTRIMIMLAALQGLRVSEIAAMRGEYIRGDQLRVIGKGGVDVDMPLHPALADIARTMPAIGWWFPSHTKPGEHILGASVSSMISKAMQRAGVPGTPHALRHFFGTYALRSSGGNLVVTKQLMRHASIATTAGYTEVDTDDCRAAVLGLPAPRGNLAA